MSEFLVPDAAAIEQLAAQLQSPNVTERVLAMIELQRPEVPIATAMPLIQQALLDRNVQVRGMAVFSLGIKPAAENIDLLVPILTTDDDHNLRAIAAGALGYLGDRQALEPLRHAFYEDTHWLVQFSAAVALGNLQDQQAQAILLQALESPNLLLQEAAIMALGEIGAVDALDALLRFLRSDDWMLRRHLAEALGNLPSNRTIPALQQLAADENPQVAEVARRSLQRLQPKGS